MNESTALEGLRGKYVGVVASTGGHLEQGVRWADRLGFASQSIFVTFKNEQSVSLLKDRPHYYLEYIAPRDYGGIIATIPKMDRFLKERKFEAVLTTGAGLALSLYLPSVRRGVPFHYIESVSRFDKPSLTGRVLAALPLTRTYTQHEAYASSRWRIVENLLTDYSIVPAPAEARPSTRFFVTLGTIRPYRFDALVDAVLANIRPGDSIVWQLGQTTRDDLPGNVYETVSATDFDRYALGADVVISHAGVGSILRLLDLGISPVVVPRARSRGEHVDDHQSQVALALSGLGLILYSDASAIDNIQIRLPRPTVARACE